MKVKIRSSLSFRQRVVCLKEARPQGCTTHLNEARVVGHARVLLDKATDSAVEIHHLRVPSRNRGFCQVDQRGWWMLLRKRIVLHRVLTAVGACIGTIAIVALRSDRVRALRLISAVGERATRAAVAV